MINRYKKELEKEIKYRESLGKCRIILHVFGSSVGCYTHPALRKMSFMAGYVKPNKHVFCIF